MVKDHSNSEKGNPLPPHRLLLLIIVADFQGARCSSMVRAFAHGVMGCWIKAQLSLYCSRLSGREM